MRKITSTLILLAIALTGFSQHQRYIKELYRSSSVKTFKPFILDSLDIDEHPYELKELLQSARALPPSSTVSERLSADTAHLFIGKTASESDLLQTFHFTIAAEKYTKTRLKVLSPHPYIVTMDGKEQMIKTTMEDSLSKAQESSTTLTLLPSHYQIEIHSLTPSGSHPSLKIWFEEDSTISIKVLTEKEQLKHPLTMVKLLSGIRPVHAAPSFDGRYLCTRYTEITPHGKQSTYTEVTERKSGTLLLKSPHTLNWMPHENRLYYTKKQDSKRQLMLLDPTTLQEQLAIAAIEEGRITFAPDGSYFIVSKTFENKEPRKEFRQLTNPDDRLPNGRDRAFLYKYDMASGLGMRLTYGAHSTSLQDISSDGRSLLFSVVKKRLTEQPFYLTSLFRMDMQHYTVDTLWLDQPWIGSASFSPDNRSLLVTGAPEAFNKVGLNIGKQKKANGYDTQAFIYDLTEKKATPITKQFNPKVLQAQWNKFDQKIYLLSQDEDYQRVYQYDVDKKAITLLPLELEMVTTFSLATQAPVAGYVSQGVSDFPIAYWTDLNEGGSTGYAQPEKEKKETIALGEVRNWDFNASTRTTIKGRYYLPYNFDAQKKYPLIVYYYGGTSPVGRNFGTNWNYHYWASLGFVVYVLQPSGATGFGQEFSARHVNAWGDYTANEIIEGTKRFCKEHSFINADRVGCIGASYGGFMTQYLQTKTDIFAAAISHAGISALSSYWGEGYWGYGYSMSASAGSYPWNNMELYANHSPLFHANKIKTPLLLLHGAVDTNVPVGESIQMYTALKLLGQPVELIKIERENHVIADYHRKIKWTNTITAWFTKWLQDDDAWWKSMYK